ncbi:transposase [Colletotrichum musicola]|uniref:Transposase n=1 Tax=Colletotrichum musicola TaxID=2175873 RepID=A0A8H6IRX9_9PEZI|nr:transposase [Colletotrichum musicola]
MPHPQHQPPTSNYHSIYSPHPNNLIFCTYLPEVLLSQYTKDKIYQALKAISNDKSLQQVSRLYRVPITTLYNRLKKAQIRTIAFSDL